MQKYKIQNKSRQQADCSNQ